MKKLYNFYIFNIQKIFNLNLKTKINNNNNCNNKIYNKNIKVFSRLPSSFE